MKQEIILTITMLVSDREETIEKCMQSLVHLRTAVPSELIVVDTAGNEKCMSIVREYTDKIVPFELVVFDRRQPIFILRALNELNFSAVKVEEFKNNKF